MKTIHFVNLGLRQPEDVSNPAVVRPFVAELANQGFLLHDLHAGENKTFYHLWWRSLYDPNNADVCILSTEQQHALFTPGISPVLQASLEQFLAGGLNHLGIEIYSTAREGGMKGFSFSFTLVSPTASAENEEGETTLAAASITYQLINSEEQYAFWHSLPLFLYQKWRPLLVYTAFENEADIPQAEVQQLRVSYLYDTNIYAPELVERFGREKLLATPDATVEPLEDGGILLQPQKKAAAAAYLGLEVAPA
jgi:hypothetical protein